MKYQRSLFTLLLAGILTMAANLIPVPGAHAMENSCCCPADTCRCCCKQHKTDEPAVVQYFMSEAGSGACTCSTPIDVPQKQVCFIDCTTQYKESAATPVLFALKGLRAPTPAKKRIAFNQRPRSSPLYLFKSSFLL